MKIVGKDVAVMIAEKSVVVMKVGSEKGDLAVVIIGVQEVVVMGAIIKIRIAEKSDYQENLIVIIENPKIVIRKTGNQDIDREVSFK